MGSVGKSKNPEGTESNDVIPWTRGYMTYRSYIENDNLSTEAYFNKVNSTIAFGNGEAPQTPFMEHPVPSGIPSDEELKKYLKSLYPRKQIYII